MLRTPPHPGDPADRIERLLARNLVTLIDTRTAQCAARLADQVHWQRPGLPTPPAQAREATP
jgi:hypothetical protein